MMRISAYARSDVGLVRRSNEDGVFAGSTAFAVADGMGGHAAGEIASATALQPLAELDGRQFTSDDEINQALLDAVESANRSVVAKAEEEPDYQGMGTTLTAAVVQDDKLHLAQVGDSRAYLLRGQQPLIQLTTDHTVVEELVRDGRLDREQIENHPQRAVITRAIGIDEDVEADSFPPLALHPEDQILLCSDGLTGPVSDEEIAEILRAHDDGESACQALIDAANAAGGPDNITVLLIRVAHDSAERSSATAGSGPDATQELTYGEPSAFSSDHPYTGEYASSRWAAATGAPASGAPPGAARPTAPAPGGTGRDEPAQSWRLIALVALLVVVVGLLFGGIWLFTSRAWFVGEEDGSVTVFRGVPAEIAGVRLHRVAEQTDVAVEDLAPRWQQRLEDGIRRTSAADADDLVDRLREEAEDAREDRTDEEERIDEPDFPSDDGDESRTDSSNTVHRLETSPAPPPTTEVGA